jgi:peptide/nickel transport system substrate-binding protein
MSLALNRVAIAHGAMEDGAVPAGQFMPPGFEGHDPATTPPVADPVRARRLLAEAGYPQGFGLTVHCTNDRYVGDSKVCQTVAQMLSAVGIKTQVDTLPAAVFFRRAGTLAAEPEFSAQMSIFNNLVGVGLENMNSVVFTVDPARGYGSSNRGRYSSPALDQALAAAMATFDAAKQVALVQEATRMAMADQAVIPIFHMKASWGIRRGLAMQARGDQNTYANDVRPAP